MNVMTTPSPSTTNERSGMIPLSEQPKYIASKAEVDRLAGARAKIETRLAEVEILLGQQAPHDRTSHHVVAALQFAETGMAVNSGNVISSLNEERQALVQQRDALTSLISQKVDGLYMIRQELGHAVCADLADKHQALAAKMLAALKAMDAIQQEEVDFFRQIELAGYDAQFGESVQWRAVGRLDDNNGSQLFYRARELRGYVG